MFNFSNYLFVYHRGKIINFKFNKIKKNKVTPINNFTNFLNCISNYLRLFLIWGYNYYDISSLLFFIKVNGGPNIQELEHPVLTVIKI